MTDTVDPWRVIWQVELHFDITLGDLWKQDRSQPLAHRRMVCYYLLRELTNLSYPDIGKLMRRHHSTVIHGVQQIDYWRIYAPRVKATIATITDSIREAA